MMKFIKLMFALLSILFFYSCNLKVKVEYPQSYGLIQKNMQEKNYSYVLELLEDAGISRKQKVDWYHYDYAVSLYKLYPMAVRKALPYMETAYQFSNDSYEINYYLGKFYFEIGEYKKALNFFTKCNESKHNDGCYFEEKISSTFWRVIIDFLYNNKEVQNSLEQNNDEQFLLAEILNGKISLEDLFSNESLAIEEKIFLCECLLKSNFDLMKSDFYIDAFENRTFENSTLDDYNNIRLIYKCMLENNNDLLNEVFAKYNASGFLTINSSLPYLNEKFFKYISFYYWKNEEGVRANNCLHIYNRYHLKPLLQKDKLEDDLDNIKKAFNNDIEFIAIEKSF